MQNVIKIYLKSIYFAITYVQFTFEYIKKFVGKAIEDLPLANLK
jgi:hypothetical protein